MECMKGEGTPVFFCKRRGGELQFVSFADESWGIVRDGRTVCTWECDELVECLRTFLAMAGNRHEGPFDRVLAAVDDARIATNGAAAAN